MNQQLLVPPRPTISNLQWISGTQYVTPADMDLLSESPPDHLVMNKMLMSHAVGGPDRPPSKRMLAQSRAEEEQQRRANRAAAPGASSSAYPSYPTQADPSQEGWGAWASRQFNERTERLGAVGDSMDNLSANSAGWADDVNKFVNKQKKGLVTGLVKSKFGL